MITLVVIVLFIAGLAAGIPISFAVAIPAVVYLMWNDISLTMVVQRLFAGIDSFTLLAIPFFMFAGRLMNEGDVTDRIIALCKAITGAIRGGLAMVNVVASMLFAGISGAATADVASLGAVLIPAMKKDGYTAEYSVSVTVMSSIIGPIIPPSIIFILYGVLSGTSIIGLFLAGIVPGIILGLGQILVVYLEGKKHDFPRGEPTNLPFFAKALARSSLALILPFIIIGGMLAGVFTATEAGCVASFYALILGTVIYRKLKLPRLWHVLKGTAVDTANCMIIIGTATIFAWVLIDADVPERVGVILSSISENPIVILLCINLLLLFIGTFIDNFPAMIISLPVLLPIIDGMGLSRLHFGVIVCVNLMIGAVTPPVGMCIYLGSAIGETTVERSAFAMKWLLLVSVGVLMLITYVPQISMFIPDVLGFH